MAMKWLENIVRAGKKSSVPVKELPDVQGKTAAELTTEEVEAHFEAGAQRAHDATLAAGRPVTGELDGQLVRKYPDGVVTLTE